MADLLLLLKTYARAFSAALLMLVLVGVYVKGCTDGVGKGREDGADAVRQAERERDAATESAAAMRAALDAVNDQAAFDQAEAEKWQRLANMAADAARDAADARDRAIEEADRAIEEAKRDPTCRAQLEAPVCVALH